MKVSKTLLQAIAVAVAVSTVSSCTENKLIKPKNKESKNAKKTVPYNCPGCGLG